MKKIKGKMWQAAEAPSNQCGGFVASVRRVSELPQDLPNKGFIHVEEPTNGAIEARMRELNYPPDLYVLGNGLIIDLRE